MHVPAGFEQENAAIRKKMASSMSTVLGSKESAGDRVGIAQLEDEVQPQVVPQLLRMWDAGACQAHAC